MNNERGRPRKYLTCQAFKDWCDNDFSHLIKRVNFEDLKVNFILIALGIMLAMMAVLLTMVLKML